MPSRTVCFVCGSLGGEYQLHSQPHEGQAFFPFLEHHDPPKGSRIPGADGIVDSCRVCCAFLTQQWDTYERTNTPAIKRLYWLKRIDDGQFTGAEMKLQGEYMAQVMGLQYQPSCGDSCAPLSPDSRDDFSVGNRELDYSVTRKQDCDDGVLDLSVSIKTESNAKSCSKSISENPVPKPGVSTSRPNIDELSFVCYTCGNENQGIAAKLISSIYHVANKPYFPFLTKLNPPERATPMNDQGVCHVCDHCFSSLCHQWLTYEQQGSPNSARIFKINGVFYSNDASIVAGPGKDIKTNVKEVCYLCSQSWPSTKMCPLFTAPVSGKKDQMYFPFIRELRRPHGARPLNPDGSVHVCYSCFGNLQIQWHQYETERVPFLHRRYSLLPPSSSNSGLGYHTSMEPDIKPKSLNIEEISRHSAKELNKSPSLMKNALPLLSTSTTLNNTSTTTSHEAAKYYKEDSKSSVPSTCISIPHPLQQAGERPKKVCFLCGEKCLVTKAQILYSQPIRHEAKSAVGQPYTLPFFPFLVHHDPAPGSEPMTEDGIVISCSYCYYSLLNQWKEFEESKVHSDLNRWHRRYKLNEFVCFVCGMMVPRKKLRTLEVQKFLFLREHKAPSNALVMWGGQAVGACGSCHFSLTHQYTEFERLGLPIELRKYNWTVQHHTEENSSDTQNSNQGQDLTLSVTHEDNGTADVNEAYHSGFSSSGKLSLNHTSSSTGRLPISAIMQPSSHISPSSNSATCLSSFSAALRKLAHQTKDSSDDAILKHSMSPTPLNSSRSTTPKRAHVPLVLPSKSNNFSSTQGQNSTSIDIHRQNIERLQSSSNVSPLDYGSRSNLEHQLLRLDSREDGRNTGRDSRDGALTAKEDNGLTGRDSRDGRNTGRDSRDGRNTGRDSRDGRITGRDEGHNTGRDSRDSRVTGRDSRDGRNTGRDSRDSRVTGRDSRDGRITGRDSRNDIHAFGREDIKVNARDSRDRDVGSSVRDNRDDGRGIIRDEGLIAGRDPYLSAMHSRLPASELFPRDFLSYPCEDDAARHGLTLPLRIDPAAYMAAYHPLLLQQQAVFAQSPFRLDEQLLMEQYRMLQSSFMPFSGAGFLPGQARGVDVQSMLAAAAATQHYPVELLQQHYPYLSPSHPLLNSRFAAQSAMMERNCFDEEKPRMLSEKGKEQERLPDPTSDRDLNRLNDVDRYLPARQNKDSLKQDFLTLPSRLTDTYAHYHHMGEIGAAGMLPATNSTRLGLTHPSGLKMGSKLSPRETREKSPLANFYPSSFKESHNFLLSQENYMKNQNADSMSPEDVSPPKLPKMITNSHLKPSHDYSRHHEIQGGQSASTLSLASLHQTQGSLLLSPSYSGPAVTLPMDAVRKVRCASDSKTLFRPFDDCQATESQVSDSIASKHEERAQLKSSDYLSIASKHEERAQLKSSDYLSHSLALPTHTTSSGDHHLAILSIPQVKPVVNTNPPFELKDKLPPLLSGPLPGQLNLDPISSYVREKVERFDFKSLARECTSSGQNDPDPQLATESMLPVDQLSSCVDVKPQSYLSKLDHEAVKMRKRKFKRSSATDSDDEKDSDDGMLVRLTMIGRATPIPLDTPADKMAILEYLGLTTVDKKKELQRDKEIRRRRQLRLASISPIQYETDETWDYNADSNSLTHRPHKQTNLCKDSFKSTPERSPEKWQFLSDLGLVPLSSNHKAVVAAGREAEDG